MSKIILIALIFIFVVSSIKSQSINENNLTQTTTIAITSTQRITNNDPYLRVKTPLIANYSRKTGERLRLECEFEYHTSEQQSFFNPNDFTLYWVKNYQELLQTKKGFVHVIRKNMSSILILKKLESFDSGSYMCIAELATSQHQSINASSETTLIVSDSNQQQHVSANNKRPSNQIQIKSKPSKYSDFSDDLLADLTNDNSDDLNDEFPSLNPTIVEQFDDKGFCEPYKGSICAGIITNNYSIYSTSAQQQDLIEERLKTIIPLLMSNKNNLSKRCSTFAIPSLCLFAFPLCDRQTKQPKQICRFDCKQLQQDICKNEYFNVKSLFESKLSDNLQQQSTNFLLDCNQLPPSSDSPSDCLPIVTMTLDKLESQVIALSNQQNTATLNNLNKQQMNSVIQPNRNPFMTASNENNVNQMIHPINNDQSSFITSLTDKKIINLLYILIPSVSIPFILICFLLTFCYCRRNPNSSQTNTLKCNSSNSNTLNHQNNIVPLINNQNTSSNCANSVASNSNSNIHPSRLRMSNASLNHNKNKSKANMMLNNHRTTGGSSKSSVTSSQNNNNHNSNNMNTLDSNNMNQFSATKSNYDNHYMFPPPPPPMIQHQQMQQQQQQQQFLNMQQQQVYQQASDFTVKQFSPNSIRLLQEVGKGHFGQVYVGEIIGSFGPSSVVKAIIKTLNLKQFTNNNNNNNKLQNRLYTDELQVTSTPNIHNNNNNMDNPNLPNPTAAAHFTEQEFYNEISLYSSLKNRHLANLIGVYTTNSKLNEDIKFDDDSNNLEDIEDSASMLTDTTQSNQSNLLSQCMIFEHLNNGDLHDYLIQRASSNSAAIVYNGMMMAGSQSNLSAASSIGGVSSNYLNMQQQQRNIADFLYIGQQIASGMEYLASQNFVLKDLATRNILMSDNLTIKISIDLIAQYKECYAKDYYKFQNKPLPVRWMSPESLLYGRYTQQSDVWGFGVCLWEIFNYGCQPYSGCTNPEAIEMIRDRQLLPVPDECPQRAYALMLECWHENPMQRPTFNEIVNRLRNWENYYLFNNNSSSIQINNPLLGLQQQQQQQQQQQLSQQPPLPLPLHLQQQSQLSNHQFQMTTSYSSNSQNSKASSLLGNTASTGISTTSSNSPLPPPPSSLPPNLQQQQQSVTSPLLMSNVYYSPSKNLNNQYQQQQSAAITSTNLFASKFQTTIPSKLSSSPPSSSIISNPLANVNSRLYREMDPTSSLRLSHRYNPTTNMIQSTFNNMPSSQIDHQYDI